VTAVSERALAKVIGIGGEFFTAEEPEALRDWDGHHVGPPQPPRVPRSITYRRVAGGWEASANGRRGSGGRRYRAERHRARCWLRSLVME
jgi:hypothetical protein